MNKELNCEQCGKETLTSHYVCKKCGAWVCLKCINSEHRVCLSCVSAAITKHVSDA